MVELLETNSIILYDSIAPLHLNIIRLIKQNLEQTNCLNNIINRISEKIAGKISITSRSQNKPSIQQITKDILALNEETAVHYTAFCKTKDIINHPRPKIAAVEIALLLLHLDRYFVLLDRQRIVFEQANLQVKRAKYGNIKEATISEVIIQIDLPLTKYNKLCEQLERAENLPEGTYVYMLLDGNINPFSSLCLILLLLMFITFCLGFKINTSM